MLPVRMYQGADATSSTAAMTQALAQATPMEKEEEEEEEEVVQVEGGQANRGG